MTVFCACIIAWPYLICVCHYRHLMQAPVCDPVPRDTVWLTYLRRDDYLVRAVDPVQLKPQWNVSVGEIAADDIDAMYVL